MKPKIKNILKESTDKTINCGNCGWSWKKSESDVSDMYVCHKCGHDNSKDLYESYKPIIKSLLANAVITLCQGEFLLIVQSSYEME